MRRTARREGPLVGTMHSRILSPGIALGALWPIAAVGVALVLAVPPVAAPAGSLAVAQASSHKPDKKAKADSKTKVESKTKAEAKATAESSARAEAKSKSDTKSNAKPGKTKKTALKPEKGKSAAKSGSNKAVGVLAPPVAAALQPVLPKDGAAAPADPVPAAPAQSQ